MPLLNDFSCSNSAIASGETRVAGSTVGIPWAVANLLAPSPTKMLCSVASITRLAKETGFLMFFTQATAPVFDVKHN